MKAIFSNEASVLLDILPDLGFSRLSIAPVRLHPPCIPAEGRRSVVPFFSMLRTEPMMLGRKSNEYTRELLGEKIIDQAV